MDSFEISRRELAKYLAGLGAVMGLRSVGLQASNAPAVRATNTGESTSLLSDAAVGKAQETNRNASQKLIWGYLIHLSYNMWGDREEPEYPYEDFAAKPYLRCDMGLWRELTQEMAKAGLNMVVIDLGDGVKYESHPEIAVQGAWSVSQLRQELARLRKLGLEPIPKLNFSTAHDQWLGAYSRCVSSETYYRVCKDLISETIQLFDKPRFFHLGMDEETLEAHKYYEYVVLREYDLWWHDFNLLAEAVEKGGARPWVWSDYLWHHPEVFLKKMPKSVLQSNWYYGYPFNERIMEAKAYLDLEANGYDQIPTGSNWATTTNFLGTVNYCTQHIAPERLLGFLQAPWWPTLAAKRYRHLEAIDLVRQAIARAK